MMVDERPCNVIDTLWRVRNRWTIIIINVHGAIIMTKVIARVHSVHLTNAD